MTKPSISKVLGLALGCGAAALGAIYASAGDTHGDGRKDFHANAGTTFILASDGSHKIDGVVLTSAMGDCTFHATAQLVPTTTTGYFLITGGQFLFTSADGTSTLTASAEGSLTVNPANGAFADIQYDVTFTGGTGSQAGAHGSGKLHGFVEFTDCGLVQSGGDSICEGMVPAGANTGKACWLLDGDLDPGQDLGH